MSKPRYFVSLNEVNLHGVTSFEQSRSRDIDGYDGVGAGKYNVPGAAEPRKWTIGCTLYQGGIALDHSLGTWRASELFKLFDYYCGKTDVPIRMVKTDSNDSAANLSVLVWVKSYSYKESEEQGTYDTTIEAEEYIPVGIKTTGIPTISRPGKVPVPPKVTITKSNTVYKAKRKTSGSSAKQSATLKSTKTGKPVSNPATVKNGTTLATKIESEIKAGPLGGVYTSAVSVGKFAAEYAPKSIAQQVKESQGFKLAQNAISDAVNKFKKWWGGPYQ